MTYNTQDPIQDLQQRLDGVAEQKKKAWWEKYMKYEVPFRGVNLVDIRTVLRAWYADRHLAQLPDTEQFQLALALFSEAYAEDKLAGVLFLEEYLLDVAGWSVMLDRFVPLFTDGYIYDWNVCDWFCVRVLGRLVDRHGSACARAVAGWREADNLWQARSSAVAFVNLVPKKASPSPETRDLVLASCAALIKREERFAKTAVGWVLRELSTAYPAEARDFIDQYRSYFSSESLKNATRRLADATTLSR